MRYKKSRPGNRKRETAPNTGATERGPNNTITIITDCDIWDCRPNKSVFDTFRSTNPASQDLTHRSPSKYLHIYSLKYINISTNKYIRSYTDNAPKNERKPGANERKPGRGGDKMTPMQTAASSHRSK